MSCGESPAHPLLPGGIGLTHLKVYDTVAPDGFAGGSAHVHFACTEAYFVVAGHGVVQTLSAEGYREVALEPGSLVWFTPGLIHRLVNEDAALEIVVPMQNAGLPEAGDFVLCFPFEILSDPSAYASAASLATANHVHATSLDAAYHRRDLAVSGFVTLRNRFETEGVGVLEEFYRLAARLVAHKAASWTPICDAGPKLAVHETQMQIEMLGSGDSTYLTETARVVSLPPTTASGRKLGMCGTLGFYRPEGPPT